MCVVMERKGFSSLLEMFLTDFIINLNYTNR